MSNAYVIDKNMGHKMDVPIVPLTEEQKYLFDARGWLSDSLKTACSDRTLYLSYSAHI